MTDKQQALRDLLARVEVGNVTKDNKLANWQDFDYEGKGYGYKVNANAALAYNGSLDAALALHNAVLPGWDWVIGCGGVTVVNSNEDEESIDEFVNDDDDSPARAWLIAIFKALIAKGEADA